MTGWRLLNKLPVGAAPLYIVIACVLGVIEVHGHTIPEWGSTVTNPRHHGSNA
jgi:hypothetical protein